MPLKEGSVEGRQRRVRSRERDAQLPLHHRRPDPISLLRSVRKLGRVGKYAARAVPFGRAPLTQCTCGSAIIAGHKCVVYGMCMTRTNVDIDDSACAEVMRRYRLATKREAINYALRVLAAEPASLDEARALRGTGWEGDLDAMRASRAQ